MPLRYPSSIILLALSWHGIDLSILIRKPVVMHYHGPALGSAGSYRYWMVSAAHLPAGCEMVGEPDDRMAISRTDLPGTVRIGTAEGIDGNRMGLLQA